MFKVNKKDTRTTPISGVSVWNAEIGEKAKEKQT